MERIAFNNYSMERFLNANMNFCSTKVQSLKQMFILYTTFCANLVLG